MALLFFFFSSNLWSIYASMLFYVSRDHHHFSYGKGSSKLQIFTLPHTDPARLFCRKSLRCATNKSTKNLGCASAILSILGHGWGISRTFPLILPAPAIYNWAPAIRTFPFILTVPAGPGQWPGHGHPPISHVLYTA